jgi:pyruvate formate-lyase/glycerol dehydratase family glycyl radical enzyme
MYEFRPATDRIKQTRQLVRDRIIQVDTERAMNLTESYKKNAKVPPIIKLPLATYDVCSKMTCRIEDFEIIVGNTGKNFLGSGIWPDWDASWIWKELEEGKLWKPEDDGLYHRRDSSTVHLTMSKQAIDEFMSIRDFWKDNCVTSNTDSWSPDGFEDIADLGVTCYHSNMERANIASGHLVAGYEKIINVGYGAIRKQAQDWIDAHKGNLMGEDLNKFMFYKSAAIICDAATCMIKRYSQACLDKAAGYRDTARQAELKKMADGLMWISENPARTFWEACQGTIMYQLLLYMEARHPALAFGRFDQYTWPFLKADLEAGRITLDEAQEIVDAFFLKSNGFYRVSNPRLSAVTGVGVTYHHTTIGGVNRDTGEDASNPVTYMVLETMGRLLLHDPTISLRINKNTPDKIWDCAIETTRLVGGLPLFQNDEVIIPNIRKELGYSLRDARDYGIIGCQEIVGCGNDYPCGNGIHGKSGLTSHGTILLCAINNGVNPMNGAKGGLKTGYLYEMKSFDQVKAAYKAQFDYFTKWSVTMQNYTEYITMPLAPHAGLSISIEGCMESGKDCTAGGAKYNSFGGTATGLATVADSLTAIKYMVFDKKLCTAKELYAAVMANWAGHELLRQQILSKVPHYGNDDSYADEQMKWLCDIYHESCLECYSTRARYYKAGLYGAANHIMQGSHTWATFDGRKTGEALADGTSPAQGRDKNGPTSVFNSTCCFEHGQFMDGIALNLRIHPNTLKTAQARNSLRDMTRAYFEKDGLEVQYNVVSSEVMRAAQKDPNSYRDLVVRIAGYSAYFIELTTALQNDVISRTENSIA